jgi:NitT/TauT family transport system permease protein
MKRTLTVVLFFAALIALWSLATGSGRWSPVILPPPSQVAEYLWSGLWDGSLIEATYVTMQRLLLGYAIGVAIGLPVGLLMSNTQAANDTIGSIALGFQTLPSVCWVPLALIWFGQSETAMLFVVVMGTTWSVMIATSHGARRSSVARPAPWDRRASIAGHAWYCRPRCRSWSPA